MQGILDMSLDCYTKKFCPEVVEKYGEEDLSDEDHDSLHSHLLKIPRWKALEQLEKIGFVKTFRITKSTKNSFLYNKRFINMEPCRDPLKISLEDYIEEYHPELKLLSNDESGQNDEGENLGESTWDCDLGDSLDYDSSLHYYSPLDSCILDISLDEYIEKYHPEIKLIPNDESDEDHVVDWYLESLDSKSAHRLLDRQLREYFRRNIKKIKS